MDRNLELELQASFMAVIGIALFIWLVCFLPCRIINRTYDTAMRAPLFRKRKP